MNLLYLFTLSSDPFFIWECKGSTFFQICKIYFNYFSKKILQGGFWDIPPYI